MPFDPELVAAQLALKRISDTGMPKLAWEALEAGLDGPVTRRLAALHRPTFFEVRELLPKLYEEWKLTQLSREQAALHLAKRRAREILQSNSDPLDHTNDFYYLWRDADYCPELTDYGTLDEEVYVARLSGRTDNELRPCLLEKLKTLASD